MGSNPIARSIPFPRFLPLSDRFSHYASLQTNAERGANVRLNVRRGCGRKTSFVPKISVCGDSPKINVSPTVGRSRRLRRLELKRSVPGRFFIPSGNFRAPFSDAPMKWIATPVRNDLTPQLWPAHKKATALVAPSMRPGSVVADEKTQRCDTWA